MKKVRISVIVAFILMSLYSLTFMFKLNFQFDFESFFPKDDPDLAVFKEFIKDFETDDNFLLIGGKTTGGDIRSEVFDRPSRLNSKIKRSPSYHRS